jgi:gluconate 2-dehydrogenase gamma chain
MDDHGIGDAHQRARRGVEQTGKRLKSGKWQVESGEVENKQMAISRRNVLKAIGAAAPVAAGFTWTSAEAEQAHQHATAARKTGTATRTPFKPKFFTAHEWATVKVLVDLIIPKDERSGSATDAGVPEFMDFMLAEQTEMRAEQTERRVAMRGGLHWLDTQCRARFEKPFVECAPAQQTMLLDDIAWPSKAPKNLSQGVAFFNSFRDFTASGFWSSKIGVQDLQYIGNVAYQWDGCPPEALAKLGLKA